MIRTVVYGLGGLLLGPVIGFAVGFVAASPTVIGASVVAGSILGGAYGAVKGNQADRRASEEKEFKKKGERDVNPEWEREKKPEEDKLYLAAKEKFDSINKENLLKKQIDYHPSIANLDADEIGKIRNTVSAMEDSRDAAIRAGKIKVAEAIEVLIKDAGSFLNFAEGRSHLDRKLYLGPHGQEVTDLMNLKKTTGVPRNVSISEIPKEKLEPIVEAMFHAHAIAKKTGEQPFVKGHPINEPAVDRMGSQIRAVANEVTADRLEKDGVWLTVGKILEHIDKGEINKVPPEYRQIMLEAENEAHTKKFTQPRLRPRL